MFIKFSMLTFTSATKFHWSVLLKMKLWPSLQAPTPASGLVGSRNILQLLSLEELSFGMKRERGPESGTCRCMLCILGCDLFSNYHPFFPYFTYSYNLSRSFQFISTIWDYFLQLLHARLTGSWLPNNADLYILTQRCKLTLQWCSGFWVFMAKSVFNIVGTEIVVSIRSTITCQ